VDDLREDGILGARDLSDPNEAVIDRLLKESLDQRRLHHRCVRSRDHKGASSTKCEPDHWVLRARTLLFRSKRALALAAYLRARVALKAAFKNGASAAELAALASTREGAEVIRKV